MTVRPSKRLRSCSELLMPSRIAAIGLASRLLALPRNRSSSAHGRQATILTSVDLPAPFSPGRQCTSARATLQVDTVEGTDTGEFLDDPTHVRQPS